MKDARIAIEERPVKARTSRWAAAIRRWLAALDRFLEKGFRLADVETGC